MSATIVGPRLTEAQWQTQVVELARVFGWTVAHFRPARTAKGWRTPVSADGAGFPDLVMARQGRCLFRELKAERGRLSSAQQGWLEVLRAAGQDAGVWRPSDWDEVYEVLCRRDP